MALFVQVVPDIDAAVPTAKESKKRKCRELVEEGGGERVSVESCFEKKLRELSVNSKREENKFMSLVNAPCSCRLMLQEEEEKSTQVLAYHSARVPGLVPYESHRYSGHSNGRTHHRDILSSVVCQGSVRTLNADQLSKFRHLLPQRLTTGHQQFPEGAGPVRTTPTAAISSVGSSRPTTPPFPFRAPANMAASGLSESQRFMLKRNLLCNMEVAQ